MHMDDFSMWDGQSEEIAAERTKVAHLLTASAAEPLWPFLSGATSDEEFEHRLAAAQEGLTRAVALAVQSTEGVEPTTLIGPLVSGLRARFAEVQFEASLREAMASKVASTYCPNHGVYVGEGNQEQHDHCKTEQRESKDSAKQAASDTGTCGECGRATSYDRDSRKWTHDNEGADTQHAVTKQAGTGENGQCPQYVDGVQCRFSAGHNPPHLPAHNDGDVSVGKPSTKAAASEHIAPTDHEATPEWDTAQYSDLCDTCGWPVTKGKDGAWTHDAKNPVMWDDKRTASRKQATIEWSGKEHMGVGYIHGVADNGDIYEVYFNPNMNPTPCSWVNYGPKGDQGPNSGIAEGRGFATMTDAMTAATIASGEGGTTASLRTASWSEHARAIAGGQGYRNIDPATNKQVGDKSGVILDQFTASMLVQILDALSPDNRAKFEALPLERAVDVGWTLANGKKPASMASKIAENAGLGVGHIWTNTSCPAYVSQKGKDCTCNGPGHKGLDPWTSSRRTAAQTCPSCKQDAATWTEVVDGGKDDDGETEKVLTCSNCDYGIERTEKHGSAFASLMRAEGFWGKDKKQVDTGSDADWVAKFDESSWQMADEVADWAKGHDLAKRDKAAGAPKRTSTDGAGVVRYESEFWTGYGHGWSESKVATLLRAEAGNWRVSTCKNCGGQIEEWGAFGSDDWHHAGDDGDGDIDCPGGTGDDVAEPSDFLGSKRATLEVCPECEGDTSKACPACGGKGVKTSALDALLAAEAAFFHAPQAPNGSPLPQPKDKRPAGSPERDLAAQERVRREEQATVMEKRQQQPRQSTGSQHTAGVKDLSDDALLSEMIATQDRMGKTFDVEMRGSMDRWMAEIKAEVAERGLEGAPARRASRRTAEDIQTKLDGLAQPDDFGGSTQPLSTRPRVMPSGGGGGMEDMMTEPSPTEPMATNPDFAQPANPMQPTVGQKARARVARIATRIKADNPSMGDAEVQALALRTVRTYPEMLSGSTGGNA
jgi:hypothetical protein